MIMSEFSQVINANLCHLAKLIVTTVLIICKIPLLARALGLKAVTRPSARATIGYLVYNGFK